MNGADRLERDLAKWFRETAMPAKPDYTDEIVREATRRRQRPRWTFAPAWVQGRIAQPVVAGRTRIAWAAGIIALVALALLLSAVAFVASQPRLPPPFGLAANGLLAFERGGDIFTFDPGTRIEHAIVTGPDRDHDPRWSLDGRRIVFVRDSPAGTRFGFVDADGDGLTVTKGELQNIDTDSIAWAPDARGVAVAADSTAGRAIFIVDATNGGVRRLPVDYTSFEVFWRPTADGELLFAGRSGGRGGLFLVSLDDGLVRRLPTSGDDPNVVRPLGWTSDGRRFAYMGAAAWPDRAVVVDVTTGRETPLDVYRAQVSNDGRWLVGAGTGPVPDVICIVSIDGGPCTAIGHDVQLPDFGTSATLQWAPDDRWIVTHNPGSRAAWLVARDGHADDVSIRADGPASWQRVAP
jgi:dipeptidyl aminopeptidase/acylaminoacyl peptidase